MMLSFCEVVTIELCIMSNWMLILEMRFTCYYWYLGFKIFSYYAPSIADTSYHSIFWILVILLASFYNALLGR